MTTTTTNGIRHVGPQACDADGNPVEYAARVVNGPVCTTRSTIRSPL
jgi:hypothetical protein